MRWCWSWRFEAAKALAEQEHTSLNQVFVMALAKQVSALRTASYVHLSMGGLCGVYLGAFAEAGQQVH